ncbi:bifunctional DNA-directed RNA polymerase subunit beta/beta' [compost metagenome]
MGVALEPANFDDLFFNRSRQEPVIINDFSETSDEDKKALNRLIYTKYSTDDLLSNMPTCECGKLFGMVFLGVACHNCHTLVTSPMDQELEPIVWMRKPNGVLKLINPIIWTMLNNKFKRSGFEIVRWICDTTYKPPSLRVPPVMDAVQSIPGLQRGYNNFVENFDTIVAALFELRVFKPAKGKIDPLQILLRDFRNCVFSDYLPLPNRSLLVIEESHVGTYVDPIVTGAVDAIRTMASIDSAVSSHSIRTKENRTVKTIAQLAEFYDGLYRLTLAKKEGLMRKHVFAGRANFSFRAVISSLTDAHEYDELHIPWGIGVSVLRIHLLNKLFRLGYGLNQAIAFLNEHSQKYHPLLDELFQELIAESPYKGIPVIFQRNPSLERGSAQAKFVTRVKTDPMIPTISMSILAVVGYNADFDGDQLNGTLTLDLLTTEALQRLAPHMSTFDLNEPRRVSKNLSMPKPVVASISSWVHSPAAESVDPEKLARMMGLPDA